MSVKLPVIAVTKIASRRIRALHKLHLLSSGLVIGLDFQGKLDKVAYQHQES
jgi:hypothetical protein